MSEPGADIGGLVQASEAGDKAARNELFAMLYRELHRLAQHHLARSGGPLTLSATTLLHEAYLDISERERATFPDRNRFLGYASRVMRGLIIDYSRRRQAQKRGGLFEITAIATDVPDVGADADRLSDLSEALEGLEAADARLARIVDLKYFCGFSFVEIGNMLGLSERTVQRDWEKARIYLHRVLRDDPRPA